MLEQWEGERLNPVCYIFNQCEGAAVTVPGLGLSKVQVVDAVQIHVLSVPSKGTLPHPKVQVWCVDSFDLDPAVVLHYVQNGVEMPDVPFSHILQRKGSAEAESC